MKFIDVLRIAMSTFFHNKARTLLTVFGIAIGIGAIVFLLSIGYGLQKITIDQISSIKALQSIGVTSGNSSILPMNNETILRFKDLPGVGSIDPNLTMSGQISLDKSKTDVLVNAVSAEYVDSEGPRMEAGDVFKGDDQDSVVITSTVANAFNVPVSDLLNKKVKLIAYIPNPANPKMPELFQKEYTVVGIIKDTTASYIFLPISSVKVPTAAEYSQIKVKVADRRNMTEIKNKIVDMGYKATSLGEKIDQMNSVFRIINIVLLVLGAIALIVASIGMFNTLTISLLERTKDIGIMKSLGATDKEIYSVFLSESTLISLFGGICGVAIALILGNLLNLVLSVLASKAGGEAVSLFQAPIIFIVVIVGFSLLIGILTGLYPARRAARLNPLDALRYE